MAHTMTLNGFKVESFTYPITANEGWRKNAVIIKAGPNPKYPLAWCEITPKGLCGANFPIRPVEIFSTDQSHVS